MSAPDDGRTWVGVDPGGKNAFGLASLAPDGQVRTHLVSCADEAMAWIAAEPLGVGVDAPLWWSSGMSSDRAADRWIRRTYRIPSGTVQTANSLKGAALVQAQMFIHRLRERFPAVRVTEAHPKAVAIALGGWSSVDVVQLLNGGMPNEHERDALMAAIAAREGFCGRWPRDLAIDRLPSEQDPTSYWLGPVHYFWPASS